MNRPIVFMTTEQKISPNWWRVENPAFHLNKNGYNAVIQRNYETDTVPENAVVIMLRVSADQKETIEPFIETLHARGCLLLCDIDDDILTPHAIAHIAQMEKGFWTSERIQQELTEQEVRKHILNSIDGTLVSTYPLKELVAEFSIKPCLVVPNAIDAEWFHHNLNDGPFKFSQDEVYIGWAGSGRPPADLDNMGQAWEIIARDYPQVSFVVGGWRPPTIFDRVPNDRIVYKPWTDLGPYAQSMQVDIGCTPLAVTSFNKCKSAIKAYEYGVAGAAVVSSPVVYPSIIRHGHNGYIAYTVDEWVYYLSEFINRKNHRQLLAAELELDVLDNHSMQSGGWSAWIDAIEHIQGIKDAKKALPV